MYLRLIPVVFVKSLFPLPKGGSEDVVSVGSFRTFFIAYYTMEVLSSVGIPFVRNFDAGIIIIILPKISHYFLS